MKIEDFLENQVSSGRTLGIIAGLINNDDICVASSGEIKRGAGISPAANTVFEIGSVTKTFTCLLLADLQQEGLLNVNDPVTKLVPELANNSGFEKITLLHLATHTSGLPNHPLWITMSSFATIPLPVRGPPHGAWYRFSKSDLIPYLLKTRPKHSPGRIWSYSNSAVGLLGHILEGVTGLSYEELVKRRICHKLGMSDTSMVSPSPPRSATGYSRHGIELEPSIAPALESAVGLHSTIDDMVKFMRVNLENDLQPQIGYCQSSRVPATMSSVHRFLLKSWLHLTLDEMCLGWFVTRVAGSEMLYHAGGTPGFTSFIAAIPQQRSGVVILSNQMFPSLPKVAMQLLS